MPSSWGAQAVKNGGWAHRRFFSEVVEKWCFTSNEINTIGKTLTGKPWK
jgi:hypothetical protein